MCIRDRLNNWGKYTHGFFNTIFSQKGVLKPTDGYNYIALNDDVYLYTGLTSVSNDASNVGFALINMRTKEAKYYAISGAEEFSAMSSAEGKVTDLKYTATFPILINAGGEPTYFMSLKDSAGLVKKYAFVSVENYQIVSVGDSVAEAEKAYYEMCIRDSYRTLSLREYTMIGGFSMGGLMALYAAISYHTYFSKAACLSSSIGICLEALKDEINQHDSLKDTRLFLSWGSEESRNKRALAYASMNQLDISHLLNLKGVQTYPYLLVNGRHHMISWQVQIPLFMDYLWKSK